MAVSVWIVPYETAPMRERGHMTVERFATYLRSYPQTLRCWQRPGQGGVPTTLAGLNYRATRVETRTPLQVSDTQNGLAVAADWTRRYMRRSPGRKVKGSDAKVLWRTAIAYWRLSNHLTEVEYGRRGFESRRRRILLPHYGDRRLLGLAMWLDLADFLERVAPITYDSSAQGVVAEFMSVIEGWHRVTGGQAHWFCAPEKVRDPVRDATAVFLSEAATCLPADTVTADGYTLAMFYAYWHELLSLATYNDSATLLGYRRRATFAPEFRREVFVKHIATAARIPLNAADQITKQLTLDTGPVRDVALTPIVSLGNGALFVMTSLVTTSNPERNMIKVLQSDPSRFGPVGNLLGAEGEQTTLRLIEKRLNPGILCAANVGVARRKGHDASDLDVVAYSPQENLVVVLELKWHIGVDGTYEETAIEQAAVDKRDRLRSVRALVQSGAATVDWPHSWPPVPKKTQWRWFVLTNDVLPTQACTSSIRIRSYQMLKHLLPSEATLQQLVDLLDDPPTPDGCIPHWETHRFGALLVEVDSVGFPQSQRPPFALPELENLPLVTSRPARRAKHP